MIFMMKNDFSFAVIFNLQIILEEVGWGRGPGCGKKGPAIISIAWPWDWGFSNCTKKKTLFILQK